MKNGSYIGNNSAARLMEILGRPENWSINYSCSGSGVGTVTLLAFYDNVMRNMKYSCSRSWTFDHVGIQEHLKKYGPVFVFGSYLNSSNEEELENKGHAWVCDGFVTYEFKMPEGGCVAPGTKYNETYYRMVWGEQSIADGYYLMDPITIIYPIDNQGYTMERYALTNLWYYKGLKPEK